MCEQQEPLHLIEACPFSSTTISERGFQGFTPFDQLVLEDVPPEPGVYVVLSNPLFEHSPLPASVGGWFKGMDPAVQLDILTARLIPATLILYIGKADAGSTRRRGLRKRIHELMRFGQGEPVGHWGGRYIWQLSNSPKLLVAWSPVTDKAASMVEDELLEEFFTIHGRLPFANLRR